MDTLIRQLGAEQTPCVRVFNKCDRYFGILPHGDDVVCLSAATGEGTDMLTQKLSAMLAGGLRETALLLPYQDAGLADTLRREAQILSLEYAEDGIRIRALLDPELLGKLKRYIPDWEEPTEDWER